MTETKKSWLARLRERFPEVAFLGLDWPEEKGLECIRIYLNRDPDGGKDRDIAQCFGEILEEHGQRPGKIVFLKR